KQYPYLSFPSGIMMNRIPCTEPRFDSWQKEEIAPPFKKKLSLLLVMFQDMRSSNVFEDFVGEFDIFLEVDSVFDLPEHDGRRDNQRSSEETPGGAEVDLVRNIQSVETRRRGI
ncbi:hypothetical protein LOZ00_006451, partial [Ophidiomyces ophidiicola]